MGAGPYWDAYNAPPYRAYGPQYGPAPEQEVAVLQNQASVLEQQLKQIRERLDQLSQNESNTE